MTTEILHQYKRKYFAMDVYANRIETWDGGPFKVAKHTVVLMRNIVSVDMTRMGLTEIKTNALQKFTWSIPKESYDAIVAALP